MTPKIEEQKPTVVETEAELGTAAVDVLNTSQLETVEDRRGDSYLVLSPRSVALLRLKKDIKEICILTLGGEFAWGVKVIL